MSDRPDVFTAPATYDDDDPPGFRSGETKAVRALAVPESGRGELVVRVFEIPPGEAVAPYHYEFIEEWLVVLVGTVDLRTPAGTERLGTGAIVRFAWGPDGAHTVSTPPDAEAPARVLMFSDGHEPLVAVYPDSDKVGVWVPGGSANLMVRRDGGGAVDYYDGEA